MQHPDLLVDTFSRVHQAAPTTRLVIAGPAWDEATARHIAREFALAEIAHVVEHPRWWADDEYAALLAATTVAVQLRSHDRGEQSAAVGDALSCGLAVVCNDRSAHRDLPDDAASSCTPARPDRTSPMRCWRCWPISRPARAAWRPCLAPRRRSQLSPAPRTGCSRPSQAERQANDLRFERRSGDRVVGVVEVEGVAGQDVGEADERDEPVEVGRGPQQPDPASEAARRELEAGQRFDRRRVGCAARGRHRRRPCVAALQHVSQARAEPRHVGGRDGAVEDEGVRLSLG